MELRGWRSMDSMTWPIFWSGHYDIQRHIVVRTIEIEDKGIIFMGKQNKRRNFDKDNVITEVKLSDNPITYNQQRRRLKESASRIEMRCKYSKKNSHKS